MSRHILIIEDDPKVNQLLQDLLNEQGFHTQACFDGQQGLESIRQHTFDLILLDVMLPKINGLDVLSQLRELCETPVILLTALGAEQDRIEGFKSGADDYLTKPFSTAELLLRIEAILRRTQYQQHQQATKMLSTEQLDALSLTPVERQIVNFFLDNYEQTLSKPLLYRQALQKSFNQYDRSLDMHISKIRKKLQTLDNTQLAIQTVHGQGYRLHRV
ncbi:response regulator transcription factor [Pseudoteredinibacter isoporae]|uniref:Two-component system response regulator PfeR n=1 Tax=Pseudoteredinibacter isoporae TaxID=570281 RepID=A0A7X0MXZ8_9GAMM|nr:response regulator transcription factor [Pseudoteredinibacter isoporae]MBB6521477.1 two-component system response regulator PfeR [Pseudoteredinibacter isoporae]NHO87031.1 response regulator transcription factor [Pseudoteredinibacter isoporae]NIB24516.1 response regulator transcription factor [Pseudoteredinibacter isoporae]